MADEKEEVQAAPAKKGTPIVLVVVLVLVGVLLSAGSTYFIVSKFMSETHKEDPVASTASRDPGFFYKLGGTDGILVNVGGAKAAKYLKAGIVLELNPGKSDVVTDGKAIDAIAETKILDTTMQFLRGSAIEDFDALKQDELKKKLKDGLNDRLGQGSVYDVYITGFLLQ